ncbi:MAG: hypothetical protein V4502_07355 [Pseudomonadota bacterium]
MNMVQRVALAAGSALIALAPAGATHSWGGYHWATGGRGLDMTVVRSVTPQWDAALNGAVGDWDRSKKLSLISAPGAADNTSRIRCQPIAGKTRVCNAAYGQRQWIGLASIWLSNNHISQAVTQLNDSYFDMAFYNTPAWRAAVTCQETGHDWGLDHQDESFDNVNLGSCMDYSRNPAGGVYNGFDYGPSNAHPNGHDYDQLEISYGHNDGFTTASPASAFSGGSTVNPATEAAGLSPADWGRAIRRDAAGRPNVFVKDLGPGQRKVTHVLWAIDARLR